MRLKHQSFVTTTSIPPRQVGDNGEKESCSYICIVPAALEKYRGFVCYKNIAVEEKHSRLQCQTAVVLQTVCSGLCRRGVMLDERPKSLLFLGVGRG